MNLYGKKEQEFSSFCDVYLAKLNDLPVGRVKRALDYFVTNKKDFPTIAEVREKVEELDFDLLPKEQEFRIMHGRARNRRLGVFIQELDQLEAYEKEHGEIDSTKDWISEYDRIFNEKEVNNA